MILRMLRQPNCCWKPQLLCDHCHQPIDNVLFAMVIWTDPAGYGVGKPGDSAEPRIVHKGTCDTQTKLPRPANEPWSELYQILLDLNASYSNAFAEQKSPNRNVSQVRK